MRRYKRWQENEVEFLKNNYYYMSIKELAKKLGRTKDGTEAQVQILKLTKESIPENVAKEAIRLLKETNFTLNAISIQTNISEYQLRKILRRLGIS